MTPSWDPYFWTQVLFVSVLVVAICYKPARKHNPRRTGTPPPHPILGAVCIALVAVFSVLGLVALALVLGYDSNR